MAFTQGFDPNEAIDLVTLSAIVEGEQIPAPAGWAMVFQPARPFVLFDNFWQLWKHAPSGRYAVVVRGTVPKPGSVIEDLLAVMIPARAYLDLGAANFTFQFAQDPAATVHLGFALGAFFLLLDPESDGANGIAKNLAAFVPPGTGVFIAGHSQGAALAMLIHSYLAYPNPATNGLNYAYKNYAFAQPKPGNDHYAYDYEQAVARQFFGYRVTNPLDWVPQVPLSIQGLLNINTPNPISVMLPMERMMRTLVEAPIQDAVKLLFDRVSAAAIDHFAPHVAALKASIMTQNLHDAGAAGADVAPALPVFSFYFTNAGAEIALVPDAAMCPDPKDAWCQHHAINYLALIRKTLVAPGV
jgi:hypothetical protein